MAKRTKLKARAVDPNLTADDVARKLARVGEVRRELDFRKAGMDAGIASIQKVFAEAAGPLYDELDDLEANIRVWAETHRAEICPKGSKTARLATGELIWRLDPASVRVKGAEKVIEALKAAGLKRFIRVSEGIDRQAILKDRAAVAKIDGIRIVQDEQLEIAPFETKPPTAAGKEGTGRCS